MKTNLQIALACIGFLFLAACSKQVTSSQTYQKPLEECSAEVVPHQFIIRYTDGSFRQVYADSVESFLANEVEPEVARVEYSEPDYYVHTAPVDQFAAPTSADNWHAMRISADALWAASVRGSGVVVAVIDSGMDLQHSQLSTQVFANAGEQGLDTLGHDKATNGVDDDGNGFIDDATGWDFVKNRALRVYPNADPKLTFGGDYQIHGSHVSGIIAASHSDTVAGVHPYVQGIAPNAKILPLAFLNEQGSGMMSDAVLAIDYAVMRGARVINASWGGPVCSKTLRDRIMALDAQNVIFVSAAGNDGVNIDKYREYPASLNFPSQITVGATGDHDYQTSFSNYGSQSVHIFAPGQAIISTVPGQSMASLSGTSMAAPVVAGSIALLLSAEPTANVTHVRRALYNVAFKQGYVNACQGRLDLRNALAELRRQMGK